MASDFCEKAHFDSRALQLLTGTRLYSVSKSAVTDVPDIGRASIPSIFRCSRSVSIGAVEERLRCGLRAGRAGRSVPLTRKTS